ncbi:MAG: DUF5103 domain-containing protein [Prevotellaceae bacterium]|jgi:hypothetical protein|nr:DUF5103 domain-containing protein [Prevotellaceae bacterium]
MKHIFMLFALFCPLLASYAVQTWQTQIFSRQVHTLLVVPENDHMGAPVISLNGEQRIVVSFDETGYGIKDYYYTVIHCNADWTPSLLLPSEAISGFSAGRFSGELSQNTTTLYANYQTTFPNDDIAFRVSGNYAVLIAEDNDFNHPAAVACFSVVEPTVTIQARISGTTDIELNGRFQQLEFTVIHSEYTIRDPFSELHVKVEQNRRSDNAVQEIHPTYTAISKQTYKNNRALIFEGGNQYRTIDISSEYTYGGGIERIEFHDDAYHVTLTPDRIRAGVSVPTAGYDADGRLLVNRQHSDAVAVEADYMWVHFTLPMAKPLPDGNVHILGDLCGNRLDASSRMAYDAAQGIYYKSLWLKQGGYSYQYAFVKNGDVKATLQPVEGSYWQTDNSYSIYVYHRPWGERYDKLVGFLTAVND